MNYGADKLKKGQIWTLVKFDLEDQGRSPQKTIGTLTIVCPNLVVLAWTGDELWRGSGLTDTHTDRRRQQQYPKAKTGNFVHANNKENNKAAH